MATPAIAAVAALPPWERQPTDTDRSFEAFEIYRLMGGSRSLTKTSEKLGKNTTTIEQWSRRHSWVTRCAAWDRHEARVTNERILLGTASMRERQTVLAMQLASRAQQRILRMTETEINTMRPSDIVALMRAAAEIERKAREIPEDELGSVSPDLAPSFVVQVIRPGRGMVAVQLDGRYGYIPEDQVERFKRDHPSGVVIA
jgi:hypothetical protein